MTESDLTQQQMVYCRTLMPGAEVLKHADRFNAGYPDFTVTWKWITSWWEVKFYDDMAFKSPKVQEIQCQKLATQGVCNYIIFEQRRGVRRTLIVAPKEIERWDQSADFAPGFNHAWVARYIALAHRSANWLVSNSAVV